MTIRNRELSQFGSFVYVDNSNKSIGITTEETPYVGIGTTNATSKFHVVGNAQFSGNLGVGVANPSYKLDVNGPIRYTNGQINSTFTCERTFDTSSISAFPNGVANQAFDVRFGNISMWGYIEIEITGSFANSNTPGILRKVFAIGTNPTNLIYWNQSRVAEAMGPIVENISIGEFQWDATNTTYKIPISHIVSAGNNYVVKIKTFTYGQSQTIYDNLSLSSVYTLTALSANDVTYPTRNVLIGTQTATGTASQPLQVTGGAYVSGNLGIGTTNPTSNLHVVGGASLNSLSLNGANNPATGGGQIYLNGANGNRIDFNINGVAAPAFTTRSAGTKIVLYPVLTASQVDFAFGIDGATLWSSVPDSSSQFKWYAGTTNIATLSGAGVHSIFGDGSTLYGPNTGWSQYLRVGGNGNADTTNASVVTTNGNLHIDARTGTFATYINFYKGTSGINFGNGAGAIVASINSAGDFSTTGQINSTKANNPATGGGQIHLNGANGNRIDFSLGGAGAPAFTTRSVGTKIVLWPEITGSAVDYALGIEGSTLWFSVPQTTSRQFKWYAGTTNIATLFGEGELAIGATTRTGTADQKLQVTGGAYVSGPVAIGNTTNTVEPVTALKSQLKVLNDEVSFSQGYNSYIVVEKYGVPGTSDPGVLTRKARGTLQSPSQILSGDRFGFLVGSSYGNTTFDNPIGINYIAEEDHTDTARGCYIRFDTTNIGVVGRTEKVRITGNGNVGIGTTNPTSKLQVVGSTLLRTLSFDGANSNVGAFTRAQLDSALGISNGSAYSAFAWNYTSGEGEFDLFVNRGAGGTGGFNVYDVPNSSGSPTLLMSLKGDGNLLLGAFAPTGTADQKLQVTGGAYVSGNLGIGTTNPTSKLHVVADARFSGIVTANQFSGDGSLLTGVRGALGYYAGNVINSSTTTLSSSDLNSIILVDTSSTKTINLPAGSGLTVGSLLKIVDVSGNAATYNINIVPNASDQINGAGVGVSFAIDVNGGKVDLIWTGTIYDWRIIG